jgi:hypothetical protein
LATESEIRNKISNAKRQKDAHQMRVDECERQVRLLRNAYDELGKIKDSFRDTRKSIEKVFEEKGKWRGEKYNDFCKAGESLDNAYGRYYKNLDAAQDAVNTKISELVAERARRIWLIGELVAQINQWWIDIENLWN